VDIVFRATAAFVFILFLTRAIGRRELSTLQPFDLIMLVMMGDLVQQGVTQFDTSVTGLMLAGGTVGALTLLVSYLSFKVPALRPVLDGDPVIVVQDGEPIERNLRRHRLTVGEVASEARLQNISSLKDVEWAVLETSGNISFIKKQDE
jgi:uncharacterized membrane protein YcaP (DUF421 family)